MTLRVILIFVSLTVALNLSAQNLVLPINDFYKDRLFSTNDKGVLYHGDCFLPATETDYPLHEIIRDSSKQYYELGEVLFKKHVIEVKGKNFSLHISPLLDLAIGKDLKDTASRRLFQNTRGIYVEGELFDNFSFTTSFQENQSRFARYQTDFYTSLGELYPNQTTGTYTQQNAVIPGAARTKPFKGDGFDYACATGNIFYRPFKWLSVLAGNTQSFIGTGYRSLFLSDNPLPSPFYRFSFQITKRLQFHYYRSRLLNLIRKPVSTTVEAYYEQKAHSVNYLHFKFNDVFSLQLIESVIWSKGDSIISKRVHPMFYNPVPLIGNLVMDGEEINSITGLQFQVRIPNAPLIYGQLGVGNLKLNSTSCQVGSRWFNAFGIPNLFLQMEYNFYSSSIFVGKNARLSHTHGNAPLAHPKGNGFHEGIFRINYEWNRLYIDNKTVYYSLFSNHQADLLEFVVIPSTSAGPLLHEQIELGYRINKKMNTCLFVNFVHRREMITVPSFSTLVFFGLRTGVFNRYTDF